MPGIVFPKRLGIYSWYKQRERHKTNNEKGAKTNNGKGAKQTTEGTETNIGDGWNKKMDEPKETTGRVRRRWQNKRGRQKAAQYNVNARQERSETDI